MKGVVSSFRHASVFTPAHVVGSMLAQLQKRGYCYGKKRKDGPGKIWYPTELGIFTMINVIGEHDGQGDYRRCTTRF